MTKNVIDYNAGPGDSRIERPAALSNAEATAMEQAS
jgi:hypothetical protein